MMYIALHLSIYMHLFINSNITINNNIIQLNEKGTLAPWEANAIE